MKKTSALVVGLAIVSAGTACSRSSATGAGELHLGYFPNLTHAAAIVGVHQGFFQKELGGVELKTTLFNAGPAVVEALFSGALDVAYVGPNPAINAYTRSQGKEVRIIAGAASGGAALVVSPAIQSIADLKGKTIATPQLGNTQDVALRSWLAAKGFETDTSGGGDVHVGPQENAQALQAFIAGDIDGAWVPEPWVSRLVSEGHGHILVDERTLWPRGRFATVNIVARTEYLREHATEVRAILRGHVEALDFLRSDAAAAQAAVNDGLKELTGKTLGDAVLAAAWARVTFTADPIATSLPVMARRARDLGLVKVASLDGIYELGILNGVLRTDGKHPIAI